jgi:hypothetical protein
MKPFAHPSAARISLLLGVAIAWQTFAMPLARARTPISSENPAQFPGSAPQHIDPAEEKMEREAQKKRNLERQQEIRRDSEKLLELATELKQYVDKTNENVISLDVIKKADQIEKLAKSVKEKMKQ